MLAIFGMCWIGFAVVSALAAQARGRSPIAWLLLGLVFGLFALLAVLVMQRDPDPDGGSGSYPERVDEHP